MKPVSSLILPPLSGLFSLITRLRLAGYRRGWFSVSKLEVPVISVGNITTGGTGKTPLVEWVCRNLRADGKKVCVLTRGYGRPSPETQVVVSSGDEILASQQEAGDEPFLLATRLLGVAAVICNANRKAAGDWAIRNLGTEVFVLDDGFQHLGLKRDLNIVTVDATNPWGDSAPYGILREPRSGLGRADLIVITRTDQASDLSALTETVQRLAGKAPVFRSRMVTEGIRSINDEKADPAAIPADSIGAFCGVGNPTSFFNHLRREGYQIAFTRSFRDHHRYTQRDLDQLVSEAQALGARGLITTAKDATKLTAFALAMPCYVLEIRIAIEEDQRLVEVIKNAISQSKP